jgi:hypothetical protein
MSKQLVFLLHGMGTHDNTWHENGLKVLQGAWSEFDQLKDLGMQELIEFHPIVYDDVFETWRQRMSADFAAFKGALFAGGAAGGGGLADADHGKATALNKKIDQIEGWIGGGEPDFVWSHAMDVILYRFFTTIRMAVDTSVISQILDRLSQGNYSQWSIVGYSLGTSVLHNSLNTLYTAALGGQASLDPRMLRPKLVAMVANVSRVLERDGARVQSSVVRPGSPNSGCVCRYYLNIRHTLDPFTIPRAFDYAPWPDPVTFNTKRYQHIRPSHIKFTKDDLMDVHNFDHYLENPRVHVPFFRALMADSMISDEEFLQANAEFDAEQHVDNINIVRAALEPKLPKPNASWTTIIDLLKQMR